MHPCLETFDILFLIRKLLREEDDRSIEGTHPTLACLARTCRAFFELALDLIWEKQLGVQNLIKCMPPTYGKRRSKTQERCGWYGDPTAIAIVCPVR